MSPIPDAMSRILAALLVAASLCGGVALTPSTAAAQAGCLSDAQTRTAIGAGQARPLASLIAAVQARYGGQVVSSRLCQNGARLTYFVSVLVGGMVREVSVDAQSGAVQ
jgi:uncharacterized membrane protein YkoI